MVDSEDRLLEGDQLILWPVSSAAVQSVKTSKPSTTCTNAHYLLMRPIHVLDCIHNFEYVHTMTLFSTVFDYFKVEKMETCYRRLDSRRVYSFIVAIHSSIEITLTFTFTFTLTVQPVAMVSVICEILCIVVCVYCSHKNNTHKQRTLQLYERYHLLAGCCD